MTGKKDDGGQAFPGEQGHIPAGTWNQTWDPGMTLRDYFAAAALTGWFAPMLADEREYYLLKEPESEQAFRKHQQVVAESCYGYADAMLAERVKHDHE
jgi:hypothetical protein